MNRQMPIDKSESNPMLMGLMELVREENQELQKKQQELTQAMSKNEHVSGMMEQQKKERTEMQLNHQKKINELVKENSGISSLAEQQRKELAELQARQRMAIEKAMREDPAIFEVLKQQQEELNELFIQHQQTINKEVNTNPAFAEYVGKVKESRQTLQERQKMFDQEMLKASYMSPVKITPEPQKDEEGNVIIAEGSQVAIQILPLKNKKGMLMAFTDSKEYMKWDKTEGNHTLSMKMQDFFAAILKDGNLAGVAINPFGANIIVPRERIEMMARAAAGQRQAAMEKAKNVEMVEADINE